MNEEQRKSMELAKQVVTSLLERNNAAEMREILKDPDNWEGLQRSHGDNYYEKLVLRSIRGLMPDEIIIVLKLCYQKRQPSISKKDFANRIYYINETTPNGYKLSDTHRQIISEWAETESEQPQQENELPERVRKGLNDPTLKVIFEEQLEDLKTYLLYADTNPSVANLLNVALNNYGAYPNMYLDLYRTLKRLGFEVKTESSWKSAMNYRNRQSKGSN